MPEKNLSNGVKIAKTWQNEKKILCIWSSLIQENLATVPIIINLINFSAAGRGKASKEVIPRKGVAPISEEMVDLPVPLMANSTEEGRKSSSPRKGAPKEELSKPRKGVETFAATRNDHRKPYEATDSEGLEDSRSGLVALSVGLCIGLLVLCVFLVLTVRNMRKSWNRQQYRRVDFLIDDFDGDI